MGLTNITNEKLAYLYVTYKQQLKIVEQRQSVYDLNKRLEIKTHLSLVKQEMKRRGLKKKSAKNQVTT